MKSVGCCSKLYVGTPQSSLRLASSAQGTPFGCPKGEPYIQACKRHKNKVTHLHKQHLKKSTLPIQARATSGVGKSQADSECNERIPPDGFDAAALEVILHGRTPPPASLVPLVLSDPLCPVGISPPRGESPFSREAYILLANAVFKKLDHLHQKTPEYQHYMYRQG